MRNGYKITHTTFRKPNPAYRFENTVRMTIVGISISFFMVIGAIELVQAISTTIHVF